MGSSGTFGDCKVAFNFGFLVVLLSQPCTVRIVLACFSRCKLKDFDSVSSIITMSEACFAILSETVFLNCDGPSFGAYLIKSIGFGKGSTADSSSKKAETCFRWF